MSDRKDYSRPNQDWECGWKKRGFSCNRGPSLHGKCSGKGECQPSKDDDGYHCTRQAQQGGSCSTGPLPTGECGRTFPPCNPRRSMRARRKLASVAFVALVISLIYIGLGGVPASEDILSPGPLSSRHSATSQNCNTCHTEAHGKPWQWFFAGDGKSMSENCQSCHRMGEDSLNPHSLPIALLEDIQQKKLTTTDSQGAEKAVMHGMGSSRKVQCISCHKEHRGEAFQMTGLSNRQCQTCHEQTFASFSKDHPEFSNYPFNKRVNILFDHTSHFSKHFVKKKATDLSCNSCHSLQSSTGMMAMKGFDSLCASCHTDQIYGKSAINKGIVFFGLPTLDVETLEENDVRIGRWPPDTDGEISPIMHLMLSKNVEISELLAEFEEDDLELDDLTDEDQETLEKVAKVIWAIKKLLWNLVNNGLGEFSDVVLQLDGRELNTLQLSELSSSLPVDVLRAASTLWFRGLLQDELERYESGSPPSTWSAEAELADIEKIAEKKAIEDEDWMMAGGWYRNNDDFTIRYRPRGHADAFIKSWVDLSAKNAVQSPIAMDVLDSLTDRKNSPGKCMKCHSIEKLKDTTPDKAYQVHWRGALGQLDGQSFNRFNHSAHLNSINDKGCITCHSMNADADFKQAFEGFDATKFESNFSPIKKSACIQCHKSGQVNERCTTCHKYHVGDFFSSKSRMKDVHTKMFEEKPTVE